MCDWFSCISDGNGNIFYFNEEHRKKVLEAEGFA